MKCSDIKELLSAYLDGQAESQDRAMVEDHLGSCETCRKEFHLLKKTWDLLGEMEDIAPSPNYRDRFWTSADKHGSWYEKIVRGISERFSKLGPVPALAAAAALVIIFSITTYKFQHAPDDLPVLAVDNDLEFELVEVFDIVEHYDIIRDIEFFSDLEIIEKLDELET